VALGREHPIARAKGAVGFGDLTVTVGPAPAVRAARVDELVVRAGAVLPDISGLGRIPGIRDVAPVSRHAVYGASGRVGGAGEIKDPPVSREAPVVAIVVREVALTVVGAVDRDIETAPDEELVLVANHQIAVGCVEEDLVAATPET